MKKIAVFASGFGSNFQSIIEAVEKEEIKAEIALLVSDKPDSFSVQRAKNHHIEVFAFNPKEYASKELFETEIAGILLAKNVDLIVLAGYMRLIGKTLLEQFPHKIINIHPALLPAFPGKNAIEQAVNYGVKILGVTIHYVDAGVDTGEIIDQACFKIEPGDSLETIEARIHALEHQLYPSVIKKLVEPVPEK